jgi:hypothetical protein
MQSYDTQSEISDMEKLSLLNLEQGQEKYTKADLDEETRIIVALLKSIDLSAKGQLSKVANGVFINAYTFATLNYFFPEMITDINRPTPFQL